LFTAVGFLRVLPGLVRARKVGVAGFGHGWISARAVRQGATWFYSYRRSALVDFFISRAPDWILLLQFTADFCSWIWSARLDPAQIILFVAGFVFLVNRFICLLGVRHQGCSA
jgi:hypothetical protein